jgi:hypothetical protein
MTRKPAGSTFCAAPNSPCVLISGRAWPALTTLMPTAKARFPAGGKQPDMAGQAVRRAISKARGIVERGRGMAGDLSRGKDGGPMPARATSMSHEKGLAGPKLAVNPGQQRPGSAARLAKPSAMVPKRRREITRLCGREGSMGSFMPA